MGGIAKWIASLRTLQPWVQFPKIFDVAKVNRRYCCFRAVDSRGLITLIEPI